MDTTSENEPSLPEIGDNGLLEDVIIQRIDSLILDSPPASAAQRYWLTKDEAAILKSQIKTSYLIRGKNGVLEEFDWSHRKCYELHISYMNMIYRDIAIWIPLTIGIFGYSITKLSNVYQILGVVVSIVLYLVFYTLFLRSSVFIRANRRFAFVLEYLTGNLILHLKEAMITDVRPFWITSIRSILNIWTIVFLVCSTIFLGYYIFLFLTQ